MRRLRCVECGEVVDGVSRFGVVLQFCCLRCYAARPIEISAAEAMTHLGCTPADLKILDWREPWPNCRAFENRRYVRIEAEHLGRLRKGKQFWEDRHKRKGVQDALIKKRTRLEKATHVHLVDVRDDLRPFVIGDYLAKRRNTRMTQKTVQARLAVHRRAARIIDRCQTDPMTALDFCVTYPTWGPEQFIDLRERLRRVLHLEGARILHKVPCSDRLKLKETPLKDVYEEFSKRNSSQLVLHYLKEQTGANVASEIMQHPACQPLLRRGGEEQEMAKKLLEFWNEKDNKDKRRARLERALKERDLEMSGNAWLYESYLNGTVWQDVSVLVAYAEFGNCLETLGANPNGHYFNRLCPQIKKLIGDEHMSIEEAVIHVMKKVPKIIPWRLKSH